MKPGDRFYRVVDLGSPELQSVTIEKITPHRVWFRGRASGLAFGCRTGMPIEEAEREVTDPTKAIDAFVEKTRQALTDARQTFEEACTWATAQRKKV